MKKILTILCVVFLGTSVMAQDFLQGAHAFSSKEDSYLYLKDGTEIVGTIKDIDRKKGLIEEITLKIDGKKTKFKPEDIDYMYLMPSGFDKFAQSYTNTFDLTQNAKDRTMNEGLIKDGYVLFETTEVMIKKKKRTLLLQLVNPGYQSKIRVYFDPFAKESASLGIGGFNVAGGGAKSYYIKKGEEVAYKLTSKEYKKDWKNIYNECSGIENAFEGKMKWNDFSKHVSHFTSECK